MESRLSLHPAMRTSREIKTHPPPPSKQGAGSASNKTIMSEELLNVPGILENSHDEPWLHQLATPDGSGTRTASQAEECED